MADVNNVTLTGRLVRDAELKKTARNVTICEFTIANNFTKRTGDVWSKDANYFDLAIFDKKAMGLYPFLKQGVLVGVEAELRQNRWEKDGKKRSSIEIHVRDINLLSSPKNTQEQEHDSTESQDEETGSNYPEGDDPQLDIY